MLKIKFVTCKKIFFLLVYTNIEICAGRRKGMEIRKCHFLLNFHIFWQKLLNYTINSHVNNNLCGIFQSLVNFIKLLHRLPFWAVNWFHVIHVFSYSFSGQGNSSWPMTCFLCDTEEMALAPWPLALSRTHVKYSRPH